jgi:hypothetical protein
MIVRAAPEGQRKSRSDSLIVEVVDGCVTELHETVSSNSQFSLP